MKKEFLKMAGVKSEKDFYRLFPTEQAFFDMFPEAKKLIKAQVGLETERMVSPNNLSEEQKILINPQYAQRNPFARFKTFNAGVDFGFGQNLQRRNLLSLGLGKTGVKNPYQLTGDLQLNNILNRGSLGIKGNYIPKTGAYQAGLNYTMPGKKMVTRTDSEGNQTQVPRSNFTFGTNVQHGATEEDPRTQHNVGVNFGYVRQPKNPKGMQVGIKGSATFAEGGSYSGTYDAASGSYFANGGQSDEEDCGVGYYWDGQQCAECSGWYAAAEVIDPTGVMSYAHPCGSARQTFNDPNASAWDKGVAIASSAPLGFGKFFKGLKLANTAVKTAKATKKTGKLAKAMNYGKKGIKGSAKTVNYLVNPVGKIVDPTVAMLNRQINPISGFMKGVGSTIKVPSKISNLKVLPYVGSGLNFANRNRRWNVGYENSPVSPYVNQFVNSTFSDEEYEQGGSILYDRMLPIAQEGVETPKVADYSGFSVWDFLTAQGMRGDYATRKKFAKDLGIEGYTGKDFENLELIEKFRKNPELLNRYKTIAESMPAPSYSKQKKSVQQEPIIEEEVVEETEYTPEEESNTESSQSIQPVTPFQTYLQNNKSLLDPTTIDMDKLKRLNPKATPKKSNPVWPWLVAAGLPTAVGGTAAYKYSKLNAKPKTATTAATTASKNAKSVKQMLKTYPKLYNVLKAGYQGAKATPMIQKGWKYIRPFLEEGGETNYDLSSFLSSIGEKSDFSTRKKIAKELGLPVYKGTREEDQAILDVLITAQNNSSAYSVPEYNVGTNIPYYQEGGYTEEQDLEESNQEQQVLQMVQEMIMSNEYGTEEIVSQLTNMGIPEETAMQIVSQVQQELGKQQMMQVGGGVTNLKVNETLDVTPEEMEYLRQQGYKFDII